MLEGGRWGGKVFLIDFGGVADAAADPESFATQTVVGTYGGCMSIEQQVWPWQLQQET